MISMISELVPANPDNRHSRYNFSSNDPTTVDYQVNHTEIVVVPLIANYG